MDTLNKLVDLLIMNMDTILKTEYQLPYEAASKVSLVRMLVSTLKQQLDVPIPEKTIMIKHMIEIIFIEYETNIHSARQCICPQLADAISTLILAIRAKIERMPYVN